ncbi:hypothetical protein X474_18785 [Dethiosulfatarculus sandiegensis]|uniref:Uncharacterized protein n=1 Tax=Dethiosulfatarculus sandiegensis TaxID=1429043 RepID=A0A0D2GCB5_9BACT|nr:hypothetical protein X474_18785 [Dethiosulfatarculus sandiegensis]
MPGLNPASRLSLPLLIPFLCMAIPKLAIFTLEKLTFQYFFRFRGLLIPQKVKWREKLKKFSPPTDFRKFYL